MQWLDKMEKKFGHLAIKNLMVYIVALNALVFFLRFADQTGVFISRLSLYPELVLKGEIWRLITFAFIPPSLSVIWIIFVLQLYYTMGISLEHEWGTFRFNLYYFIGILGTIAASFASGFPATSYYLNLSLFLAFARIYPNFEILLFFIFPVKIKYLALIDWIFIGGSIVFGAYDTKLFASISIINYLIFFGKDIITGVKTNRQAYQNRKRFYGGIPRDFTLHKCTTCGITERDNPKLDFRFCTDCDGDYEYCADHLENHEHIKEVSASENNT